MKLILKEKEYIEKCINEGIIDKKPSKTIVLLSKYYYNNGMDKEQIIAEINDFMKKNYKKYNEVLWNDLIENIVKQTIKNKQNLINVDSVNITKSEMNFIRNLKSEKFQKLAFTYLVYAKTFNQINPENKNWVNGSYRNEIFKDANVTETGSNQLITIHNMIEEKILTIAKNITNNSLNVGNYISDENEEIVLSINDFRELGLQYLKFIGDKNVLECSECGRLVYKVGKKPPQYCKKCKREKQLVWQKESMKKLRN